MNELEERARAMAPYLIALRGFIASKEIRLLIAGFLDALDAIDADREEESKKPYSEDF